MKNHMTNATTTKSRDLNYGPPNGVATSSIGFSVPLHESDATDPDEVAKERLQDTASISIH